MLQLGLNPEGDRALRILCLGAHPDDIEIGCGGTLLTLLWEGPDLDITWVVFSGSGGPRGDEATESAHGLLNGDGVELEVEVHGFRDRFFPSAGAELKEAFDGLGERVDPDLVFTHHERDRHQDHRRVSELTWNTFRDHLILEYEIPKYEGDLGQPNLFQPLTEGVCERKVLHLMDAFPTQREKRWFDEEAFRGLMRLRGIECAAPSGYAEAFHGHKVTLSP